MEVWSRLKHPEQGAEDLRRSELRWVSPLTQNDNSETTKTLFLRVGRRSLDFLGRGFLLGDLFETEQSTRLVALEPHRRGRMPVVLIHGTASSPFRWADMVNDLTEDARIRDNYEFWFFAYATGNPVPYSALLLRDALQAAVQQLGGVSADPALGRMVLIGHSQGGLLARMLTVDAGPRLWDAISRRPLDQLRMNPDSRELVRRSLFVEHLPEVERVIFIATPHRGSYLTEFSVTRLLGRMVSLPAAVTKATTEGLSGNADAFKFETSNLRVGSLYGMTPGNPWIRAMAELPVAPGIHAHSIIPTLGNGPLENRSDGVVRYSSAHLDGVDSELVVPSSHSVQANPAAIEEVRRILLLQLAASGAPSLSPIAPSGARSRPSEGEPPGQDRRVLAPCFSTSHSPGPHSRGWCCPRAGGPARCLIAPDPAMSRLATQG